MFIGHPGHGKGLANRTQITSHLMTMTQLVSNKIWNYFHYIASILQSIIFTEKSGHKIGLLKIWLIEKDKRKTLS